MSERPRRVRLDERIAGAGLAESRSQAQRLIMAGQVRVNGQVVDRASAQVSGDDVVVVEALPRFVSRGGEKLDNAIVDLGADLARIGCSIEGAHAIDIGASTGGFTDCLLQRGAAAVIAVDVGYGQLHPRLRGDARVEVMERTNARRLEPGMLPFQPDLIVCDASFISLRTVLPAPLACMRPGFHGLVLCKPQFEAGRERLGRAGRKGVLRDEQVRAEVIDETVLALTGLGVAVEGSVEARPAGARGNREQVLLIRDISSEMAS